MLESGMPLLEAIDTIHNSLRRNRFSAFRSMLITVRDQLRNGSSLSDAMARHRAWFDPVEHAIVAAGQHSGALAASLRSLAERQERAGELSGKLIGALSYPAIVAI